MVRPEKVKLPDASVVAFPVAPPLSVIVTPDPKEVGLTFPERV